MPSPIDHIVIAVDDLETAVRDYRDLGFTVVRGGVHANRATHNALITLADGTYLELLAATGEAPLPGLIDFSVLLQHGEGWVGFALGAADLEAEAARLRAEGFAVGEVMPGERRRADGTVIRWQLALLDGGFAPFLIEDVTPRDWRVPTDPAVTTHANGVRGLRYVEIAVNETSSTAQRYAKLTGTLPPLGWIKLREVSEEVVYPAGLYAVHLVSELVEDQHFPLERTHGVRLESSPG